MFWLILVTLLWAFSFSLIGVYLAGQVDPYFSVLTRVLLALAVFLPLLRPAQTPRRAALQLMGIGAIQLGLMYLFYYQSFLLLSVPEVLLFTIFTPVYIALIYDGLQGRLSPHHLIAAAISVLGAAVIRWEKLDSDYWLGFLVVQGANLCFAIGQVAYKQLMSGQPTRDALRDFGWFYLGAATVATVAWLVLGKPQYPTTSVQWGVLVWLGIIASGAGYFLWNRGATQVDAGTLAAMNNALIPAGLLVNLLIWNRDADLPRLLAGGILIAGAVVYSEACSRKALGREPPK